MPARVRGIHVQALLTGVLVLSLGACGSATSPTATTEVSHAPVGASTGGTAARTQSGSSGSLSTHTSHAPASETPHTEQSRANTAAKRYLLCLQQNSVRIPPSDLSSAGLSLKGVEVSSAQYRAAAAKCHSVLVQPARASGGAGGKPETGSSNYHPSPRIRELISTYAQCLRKNGVNLPKIDTSKPSPLKGLDYKSPQYKAAAPKCQKVIIQALKANSHPRPPAAGK